MKLQEDRSDPSAGPGAAPDRRFLDGDALRVARVKTLEKALGITLTAEESARCASAEETTAVFTARLGAAPGAGNLRAGALGAVREALREVARADRESVDESTRLAPFFPRWQRTRRWRLLGRELNCKLPPVRSRWATVGELAPIVVIHAAFIGTYPTDLIVDHSTMVALVVFAAAGVGALIAMRRLMELPERLPTVERLVTWLVAHRPGAIRGGTEWTAGQIGEAVDAVHRLRFLRPGCRRAFTRDALVALLAISLIGTSLTLCLLGLASQVRTTGCPFPR